VASTKDSRMPSRSATSQGVKSMRASILLILTGLTLSGLWSQEKPQVPPEKQVPAEKKGQEGFKIGVEVNLVTVPVTVRNPGGGFIKALPQSSFRVLEDGQEQEILSFSQEGVPTRIALVLDISGSVRLEWGSIKFATRKFIENLKPEDQFSLVTFNEETRLKMDWGSKADRLDPVLTSVYCKGGTNLWDALWVVSNDVFKNVREKKAMILMSDGLDTNSTVSYNEMLDSAIRSESMIYVVSKTEAVRNSLMFEMAKERIYNIPHEAFVQADLALRKIAFETGGRVLYPNNFGQLDNVYAEVGEELRNQYTIAYISNNTIKDGSYRRIQVQVNHPTAVVAARPGYFAPNELPSAQKRQ
jgi:Ca-activated chloride channel homolog